MTRFQKYLSEEIKIDYKACLYFFAIAFYCCVYRLFTGSADISILHLAEMMAATYVMGYIQVYFLRDFDDGERFGLFEGLSSLGCTMVYTVVSWLFGWLDQNIGATFGFAGFMLFMYGCMFVTNKLKRNIDTKKLNDELEQFKKSRGEV